MTTAQGSSPTPPRSRATASRRSAWRRRRRRQRRSRSRPTPPTRAPMCSTTESCGSSSTRTGGSRRCARTPTGARRSPRVSRPAPCGCTRDLPNLWDAWDLDAHYRRTVTELITPDERTVERGADGSATVVVVRTVGSSTITERISLRAGGRRDRHRVRHRLARTREDPQARDAVRRARRPDRRRDAVRPRASAHPHEHELGCRAVRGVPAPVRAPRRARVGRRGRERLDLRLRRRPTHPRRRAAPPRPCASRCCAPRSSPIRMPTRVDTCCASACGRRRRSPMPWRSATTSRRRCAASARRVRSGRSSRRALPPW